MFRPVKLPTGIPGRLLLHSMPGRREPLDAAWRQVSKEDIQLIVCLAPLSEIRKKSPAYGQAIEARAVPCQLLSFEIPDYEVPDDRLAFWKLATELANRLRAGEVMLIHCGAGIGRTGTLAACVLIALGETASRAQKAVSNAGSHAERPAQVELIMWCAVQTGRKGRLGVGRRDHNSIFEVSHWFDQ